MVVVLALSTEAAALASLRTARSATFAAYTLAPGKMLRALEAAAAGGTHVVVRLASVGFGADAAELAQRNAHTVAELRRAGIDASLCGAATRTNDSLLHTKGLVCDGTTFLCDRNWVSRGDQIVVRDSNARDAAAVIHSIVTDDADASGALQLRKGRALADEAATIARAKRGDCVDVASESFGPSVVATALRDAAARGVRCRVEVDRACLDATAAAALHALTRCRVDVRVGSTEEKFAVVRDRTAWAGSANATGTNAHQRDWGVRLRHGATSTLQATFDAHWKRARPLR